MTAKARQVVFLRVRLELLVKLFRGKTERNVHERTIFLLPVDVIETVRSVDDVVEELRLFEVAFIHLLQTAFFLEPIGDELHDINAEGRRRVEHRILLGELLVGEHRGKIVAAHLDEIVAHD